MTGGAKAVLGMAMVVAAWACAHGTGPVTRTPNEITPAEIAAADVRSAYELVERLRPVWLRSRGERSLRLPTEIVIYQNETMLGGIETLRALPIEMVHSMRLLDSAEAGRLTGLGSRHVERVIMVVIRP